MMKTFWFLFFSFLVFLTVYVVDSCFFGVFIVEGINILQFAFGMYGLMFGFYAIYWFGRLEGRNEGFNEGLKEGYDKAFNGS